ncbi:Cation efflux system protein CzcI [Variovorax sp. SRS16]|uniref:hypothetical protein n=1 Tax=Variovorax sp. SRS16 TaxID=282217 RepID=UPI0013169D8C|nr:hypothetical protein [Variovorax sp. SRS16]VTU31264.1 Cation efflux system protein CzcI [Variovorax sp. SRS16]
MRCILLFLLIALLPFHSAWSAAAAFCEHEEAGATAHFGHHEGHHPQASQSHAADEVSSAADEGTANTSDGDYHHFLGANPLPSMPKLPAPVFAGGREPAEPTGFYPSTLIAALERPPKSLAEVLRRGQFECA